MPLNGSIYEKFTSSENFRLAWERVRYFDRPDSRDWVGLKVFAANRDHNLEILRDSVIQRTFEPSFPEIKYFPKPSMTLRPMAILPIRDRIVFQAIANVVAESGRAKLAIVTNRQSFARVLLPQGRTKFFVHWKKQYKKFQNAFVNLIEEGNIWLAETDIAAFYETVNHSHLFEYLLSENFLDEETLEHLEAYLPIWCSVNRNSHAGRGIPQGCIASDFLANVYLHEFDKLLAVQEYSYLRYVDDIRLLGTTKEAVQRGLIKVDKTLKSYGLLLQTKKTTVRKVTNVNEEVDRLAALLSEIDQRLNQVSVPNQQDTDPLAEFSLNDVALINGDPNTSNGDNATSPQEVLVNLFWKSKRELDREDGDPFAGRHLRFSLYRLRPRKDITSAILPYFIDRPWMSEIIALYLQRCDLDEETKTFLKEVIAEHEVYDRVVSLAIRILLHQEVPLRSHQNLLKQWVVDDKRQWSLLTTSVMALGESQDNMPTLLRVRETSNSPAVRRMAVIQALRAANSKEEVAYIAEQAITDPDPSVTDTLIYLLYVEWGLTLGDLGVDFQDLSDQCVASAKGYDNSLPDIQADYIRHILVKRYKVASNVGVDFRTLLGQEYQRTAKFLWQAERSYLSNPSRFVSQLDLFHEELLYPILVDKLGFKNSRKDLAEVELSDRIQMLHARKQELATFSGAIMACRRMRANPETHSRFHKELTRTNPISPRGRDKLKRRLYGGYQELVDWLEAGCP